MIKGILFDKDGTLIEFLAMWHEIIAVIFNDMRKEHYLGRKELDELKRISGFNEKSFEKDSFIKYASTNEIIRIWHNYLKNSIYHSKFTSEFLYKIFDKYTLRTNIKKIPLLKGVKELLNFSKNNGIFLGVTTADTLNSTVDSLKLSEIYEYFDFIGSSGEGINLKPHKEMADTFCKLNNIMPSELLIVGDSAIDMIFAENVGANFIGIKSAHNDYGIFEKNKYKTVEDLSEIIDFLRPGC